MTPPRRYVLSHLDDGNDGVSIGTLAAAGFVTASGTMNSVSLVSTDGIDRFLTDTAPADWFAETAGD